MTGSRYPTEVETRFRRPRHAGRPAGTNAEGIEPNLVCGSFVELFIEIDPETKLISDAGFATDGCPFVIAAADILCGNIVRRRLTSRGGVDDAETAVIGKLSPVGEDRWPCVSMVLGAFRGALADFRERQLVEFVGERALICTCFGVSEETIETLIAERRATTAEEIGEICNAGTGCGSCLFLIREMTDSGKG